MVSDIIILLNIQPNFADYIIDGTKKWEYRRRAPKIKEDTRMLLYASGNVQAIVGECLVTEVLHMPLESLIERTIHETPSTREGLSSYFSGIYICSALRLKEPKKYEKPITLSEIIDKFPGFVPPQSFYYLRSGEQKFNELYKLIDSRRKAKNKC